MKDLGKDAPKVNRHTVPEGSAGQRLDNYLTKVLKGVPKSHVYRILRSGEVRVNGGRSGPDYRVAEGDELRLPPLRLPRPRAGVEGAKPTPAAAKTLEKAILFEDDVLLALNKPAGLAVHGGSGVAFGVIEQLRALRPQGRFLELVHRLDRETSGVLLLARKRSALTNLHEQIREGRVQKHYLALVHGRWEKKPGEKRSVKAALRKYVLSSGERRVSVGEGEDTQAAHTVFALEKAWQVDGQHYSLLRAELKTGRTHQIRVHLQHLGLPIAGDDKYGDFELNKKLARKGLKRMFLHATRFGFTHPVSGEPETAEAPLAPELAAFLQKLEAAQDG